MATDAETSAGNQAGRRPILVTQLIVLAAVAVLAAIVAGLDPLFAAYEVGG